jgi:uroporphyrin-3 C-methyltransferase
MSKHSINSSEVDIIEEAEVRELPDGRQRGAGPSWLALVLALIALSAVAGTLYFGYEHWKNLQTTLVRIDQTMEEAGRYQKELQVNLSAALESFEAQKGILEKQKQHFSEQQKLLSDQENQLAQERSRLDEQNVRMQETLGAVHQRLAKNSTEWMAVEAEYLLQVANHRLRLEGDVQTAILALQSADSRLKETGDPGWIHVRELIAAEIGSLEAVEPMDWAGLSSRLSGLAEQVDSLRFKGTKPLPPPSAETEAAAPEDRSMETMLKDGWRGLKSMMVIRHHGQPVTAMFPPDQQHFVYQNLRLQFEGARLALLRRNQPLFNTSLQTAEQWIRDFFDPEDAATQAMLEGIGRLRPVNVNPAMPDVSGSLLVLRERLKHTRIGSASE